MSLPSRIAMAALLAAVSLAPAAAMAGEATSTVAVPPFYQDVLNMKPEGKLGQIIKQEKVDTPIAGAQAWRIAYVSSDLNDKPTIATGLVVAPLGEAPAGGRPIISWSHGTTGNAQNCGPSQVENPARPLNQYFLVNGNSWTDYGLPSLAEFIKDGYVVVGTDYQGLGGGGRHQYAVAKTNGRDAINAARAAGSMAETGAGKKTLMIGWSQGAGSTLGASQADYIAKTGTAYDGIDVVGFVAMSVPDLAMYAPDKLDEAGATKMVNDFATAWSVDSFAFAHMSMNLWGTQAAFPDKLQLSDIFTDEGAQVLDQIYANKCVHVATDTINFNYGQNYKSLLRPQPQNTLAWAQAIVAGSVDNTVKPIAPVLILYGNKDTTLPPVMGEYYRSKVCPLGGNVTRIQLPGDQNHFTTPPESVPYYLPWIKDRIDGKPAPDGCAGN
ncbi:lipase family protein [Aestuariivirga litoralis]|nr:lipase family protein [Aestuariivirga litoralis]